jgi:hypothetical protein
VPTCYAWACISSFMYFSTPKMPVRATTRRGSAPARFCRQNHGIVRRQVGPTTLSLPHAPTPSLETAPLAGLPSLRLPAGGGGRGRPPLARGGAGEGTAVPRLSRPGGAGSPVELGGHVGGRRSPIGRRRDQQPQPEIHGRRGALAACLHLLR